jgi:hypothetical protein
LFREGKRVFIGLGKNPVHISSTSTKRFLATLVAALFLLPLASGKTCVLPRVSRERCCSNCCCRNSNMPVQNQGPGKQNCPCRVAEKQQETTSPATAPSNQDRPPDLQPAFFGTHQAAQACLCQTEGPHPEAVFFPGRGQPLFILHSSLLI